MQSMDECYVDCTLHGYKCVSTCPYFQQLETSNFIAKKNAIFDIVNIILIFTIRTCYICPKYHKKIVFDGYESTPLLANRDDQVNSNC